MHKTLEAGSLNEFDTVVIGSGVLGLTIAQILSGLGQRVCNIDKSATVANGSSTKNHGWVHNGSVHAISITDPEKARVVVQQIHMGLEFIKVYAPESIVNPFEPIYVATADYEKADKAVTLWEEFGVNNKQVDRTRLFEIDPTINPDLTRFVFQTEDLRVNTRILYAKLLAEFRRNGGTFIGSAVHEYSSDNVLKVTTPSGQSRVKTSHFVYATGAGLGESYKKLTGEAPPISYWKGHMLATRRFTPLSLVSLDRDQPMVINHGYRALVNRAYDEVELAQPESVADNTEIQQTIDSLLNVFPSAHSILSSIMGYACVKPSLKKDASQRHTLEGIVLEPKPGHIFAAPGKMTSSINIAREVVQKIFESEDVTLRPMDRYFRT